MPCPDESELRELAHGSLPAKEAAALADHLARCSECGARYDLLVSALQRPTVRFSEEPTGRRSDALQADLPTNAMLDHFRIMRPLGRGGMGRVYLARDTKLGRKVALKVVMPSEIGSQPAIDSFLREARTTARFNHPHIVTIHDVGEASGLAYLALEYLEGQNLRQRIREERPGTRESIRIGLAIARALSVAHESGVLHRDLKPENVFIPRDGRLRVLDFGLARAAKSRADEHEECRLLIGTPYYMSPEQWRGDGISGASDVWAMGLIMHELLLGRRPYRARTAGVLEAQVTGDDPVPSLGQHDHIPAALAELVDGCLAKDAGRRPSAEEVARRLQRMLDPGHEQTDEAESPFRGLLPFDEQHAGCFFGREAETARFVERLRGQPVLPVVGPSGSGKSSFVKAGVIPRLRERGQWIVVETRPGTDPFGNLCSRLPRSAEPGHSPLPSGAATIPDRPEREAAVEGDAPAGAPSAEDLVRSPQTLAMALRRVARNEGARVLLFVDQLEELYTHVVDEETQRAYMQAICSAADDWQEPVRVVFTLRDDYLGRPGGGPMVQEALGQVTVLRGPAREALAEIVTRPLAMVGYRYDDEGLPGEMAEEVHGEPAALPMLQSAGRTLWERRDRGRRLLLREEYRRMGGVAGALASHADAVLEGLSATELRAAQQILLRLVTSEGTRRVVLRSALLEGLEPEAEEVLRRLTQSRLVTARRSADDVPGELELAHESLIQRWRTLARWLDESHEERAFLAEVGQAAELWDRRGRRESELWSGETLQDALRALGRCTTEVPGVVRRFLEAGDQRRRRGRRRRIAAGVSGTLLVIAAATIWLLSLAGKEREAQEARRRAERLSLDAQLESARFRHEKGEHLAARAWLRGSMELGVTREGRGLWLRLKERPLLWQVDLGDRVADLAVTRDGRRAALVADGAPITLLDLSRWTRRTLGKKSDGWFLAAFGPRGRRLAVARGPIKHPAQRPVAEVWELETGRRVRLEGTPERLRRLTFGERQIVGVAAEAIWRWDPGTGRGQHEEKPRRLQVALTDRGLLTATGVKVVTVRRGVDGEVLRRYTPDFAFPFPIAFRPDGRELMVFEAPRKVLKMVGLEGPDAPARFSRSDGQFGNVAFSADSRRFAVSYVGRSDRTSHRVEAWEVKGLRQIQTLEESHSRITSLAMGPRGRRVLTGDQDGMVKVWRVGGVRDPVFQPDTLERVRFSPDGARLVTGSRNGEILFWDPEAGRIINRYRAHRGAVTALAFGPDGKLLASGGADSMLGLWDGHTGRQIRFMPAHSKAITDLAFGPDGESIATCGEDDRARVWDVATGKERLGVTVPGNRIAAVSFHPSGKELVMATRKGLEIRAIPSGRLLGTLDVPVSAPGCARYTPNGRLLLQTTIGELVVLDPRTGEKLHETYHPMVGLGVQFHPAGRGVVRCIGPIECTPACDAVAMDERLTPLARLLAQSECAIDAAFHLESRRLATVNRLATIQLWQLPPPPQGRSAHPPVPLARRMWVGALLTPRPPRLVGSRGVVDLTTGKARPPSAAWERAVVERAWLARSAPGVLCLLTHDAHIELWDTRKDRRVGRWRGPISRGLEALESGCALSARGGVTLFGLDRSHRKLPVEKKSRALGTIEGDLLVAGGGELLRFGASGRRVSKRPCAGEVTAVTGRGGVLAAGYTTGVVETARGGASFEALQQAVNASVSRLLMAPGETLVVGLDSGHVAVWDLRTRKRLLFFRLGGPVTHLAAVEARVHVGTGTGDHEVIDLSPLVRSECELLREIWRDVGYVWKEDTPVVKGPPSDHRCRRP